MNVLVIRSDGREETIPEGPAGAPMEPRRTSSSFARTLIGADCLDSVNLRDGRTMLVDDNGHARGLPINAKATKLYHGVCRPGTTHVIRGDVVIVPTEQ